MLTPAMKLADAGRAKIDARTTETLTHPQARAYADLYFARVDSGKPLARADFPSRPLLPFMPHICLFEPIDEGADWRLRLVGTAICRRYGVDATGFTVSQLYPPEVAQKQIAGYRETAATRGMHVTKGRIAAAGNDFWDVEFCNLAIEPPQGSIRWIATGVFVLDGT
ncbi:MAG TPA: hypothetical protein DCL54_07255 [Alphaproteobacteria bacterium]|nr:hypothetical protein [Alphaproteobacteria bacterium]HAJ46360.1 hypothetical protein [Alphaproteobacteria bacterium]